MTTVDVAAVSLDLGILLGDWRNTNAEGGIARIVCEPTGTPNRIRVRFWSAATEPGRSARAATALQNEAPVFSFTFDSHEAGAFNAVFDLGYQLVHMQANVKSGVLVVVTLNEFKDQSGRSSYFDREFFHRIA